MSGLARELALGKTSRRLSGVVQHGSVVLQRSQQQGSARDIEHAKGKHEHEEEPSELLPIGEEEPSKEERESSKAFARRVRIGINSSWTVNIILFVAKMAVFVLSKSLAGECPL
ncbi:hypothetical protein TSOC_000610 [Tetrabaena socialis]|uniref:Uncharacterized protein n=1 Tax=Tetrabaena socialis TaxID=47790 RepID=A0A2J8AIZ7_9CHLO|nr:hypothetical protein TSOC_000610 [Tetrabaena socialis]|eukprot:PNH12487.1 hypothetical protein TSOC_000610 [Tetrabaena socialis]